MNLGIFSEIAEKFAKIFGTSFALGALAPALLLLVGNVALAYFVLPRWCASNKNPLEGYIEQVGAPAALLYAFAALIITSLLLFFLSRRIIRLFEGYPLRDSRCFRCLLRKQENKRMTLSQTIIKLQSKRQSSSLSAKEMRQLTNTNYELEVECLPSDYEVMPTRIGNVIRAFELYPYRRYGIDSTFFWPRLTALLPGAYREQIEGAETTFDFFLNCSVLLALSTLAWIFVGFYYGSWWAVLVVVVAMVMSYGSYQLTCEAAISWGDWVKGAFDMYRGTLLSQIGLSRGVNIDDEKRLWGAISDYLIWGYWNLDVFNEPKERK